MLLSSSNRKLKKDGILSFGILAGFTCPGAGDCKRFCYAKKGCYQYKNVKAAQLSRYEITLKKAFPALINQEIRKKKKIFAVRIHDSGDFYSQDYLNNWIEISLNNPDVIFYAYTKSLHLDFTNRPENLLIIGSRGSIYDEHLEQMHAVDEIDSIASIYDCEGDIKYGDVDASESDVSAILAAQAKKCIALIKH